jgi:hypothetical protein
MKPLEVGQEVAARIRASRVHGHAARQSRLAAARPDIEQMIADLKRLEVQASQWRELGISRVWGHLTDARAILEASLAALRLWPGGPDADPDRARRR